jgi:glycine/D-amino acid oxidase-like deaminating enzyme
MNSFWENESLLSYDVGIIGGGITGLSTAISIKEKSPNTTVAIFESGVFHSGASTKNAGFACFGSITELLEDEKMMGSSKMVELVRKRWSGLKLLVSRIGESNLDFENNGGYELLFKPIPQSEIDRINRLLYPIFGRDVFSIDNGLIEKFGFDTNRIKQLIVNPFEGQINTGKMMNYLLKIAGKFDIRLYTNTPVLEILSDGIKTKDTNFQCKQVVVCTNAFTQKIIPTIDLVPGRGQVLITKPLKNLRFKGVFHYDDGYFYFRNVGNRVLFGGGRNIDQ